MDITIHMTKATAKRILIVSSALIVLGTAAAVFAVPVTFQAGTLLKSADLNKDFAAATTVTAGTKSYSLGAVFKEATQPIYTGNLGGYTGAKSICEAAVGTPTAHMCTAEELVRSAQLGIGISSGWYSSGTRDNQYPSTIDHPMTECQGWTDNSANSGTGLYSGPFWGVVGPGFGDCSTSRAVLCCD